jgi:hypothetical protein
VEEGVRGMSVSDDPGNLPDEATKIAAYCDRVLDFARDTVEGIPVRREKALKNLDKAKARLQRARENLIRIRRDKLGKWNEDVAKEAESNASAEIRSINSYLAGPDFDIEYEKAFARQIASLLREDYMQRLDDIAAHSDDLVLQKSVAEYKDKLSTSVHQLLKRYKEARPLLPSEVRKARAEARRYLDRNFPPPA